MHENKLVCVISFLCRLFRVAPFIGVLELDLFFTLLLAENSKKARQAKPTPVTPFVKLLVIIQTGHAIPMQEFTADLKHRMRGVWRDAELVDPNTHNNKLATYHSWFAIPFSRNERLVGLNKVAPCLLCFFPFILTILMTLLRVYQGLSPEPRVCTSHTCCMQMI